MANHDAVFHALSDPTRRAVLSRLAFGEGAASQLAEGHDRALPSFPNHLRVIQLAELIVSIKQGRSRICRLDPGALRPAEDWLTAQRQEWDGRTDRLAAFLTKGGPRYPGIP